MVAASRGSGAGRTSGDSDFEQLGMRIAVIGGEPSGMYHG